MTRRVRSLAMVLGLVAAAAAGSTASRATAAASAALTTPKGYAVFTSANIDAPNGADTLGSVACPPTHRGAVREPQGGGAIIASSSTGAALNSSYPDGTSWDVRVNNSSGSDTSFTVYVVCALPKSGYTVVTHTSANPAFTQSFGGASCPANTKVLGGGVLSTSTALTVNINDSFPLYQKQYLDEWVVEVNNASSAAATSTVYAICSAYAAKAPTGYVVVSSRADNPAGAQTEVTVWCPAGEYPLGGGSRSSSSDTSVNLSGSTPVGQSWNIRESNASGSDATAEAYAVCAS